ncbi:MAG: sigma factor-like helix-turn-helix DNA-binding protein [Eubacteriales bacterium]
MLQWKRRTKKLQNCWSLQQVVGTLEPRDKKIILFRYFKNQTQTQTAQFLGMTQVQVSRREKVILNKLRTKLSDSNKNLCIQQRFFL